MDFKMIFLIFLIATFNFVSAGQFATGPFATYTGCAGLVCACFAAAGFTFGTVPGAVIAATPALTACNAAFTACEAASRMYGDWRH